MTDKIPDLDPTIMWAIQDDPLTVLERYRNLLAAVGIPHDTILIHVTEPGPDTAIELA